ncbi:hypothetical protein V474_19970 [Novosphingobium barchaimii LL02]|uniref:Uncharacterized protein n=1 Tax=Novosphingobium barchaimii LL02 TaxID=1114963 RepID=A0A0J8ALQ7_9SPHN|nr:hypothetical protein V474_19970 [Novosphingobium barchaimii LL02]
MIQTGGACAGGFDRLSLSGIEMIPLTPLRQTYPLPPLRLSLSKPPRPGTSPALSVAA